jgi:hypothetical protein
MVRAGVVSHPWEWNFSGYKAKNYVRQSKWSQSIAVQNRVNAFCVEKELTIHEFVTDAIIGKLERAHKKKRKTSRL